VSRTTSRRSTTFSSRECVGSSIPRNETHHGIHGTDGVDQRVVGPGHARAECSRLSAGPRGRRVEAHAQEVARFLDPSRRRRRRFTNAPAARLAAMNAQSIDSLGLAQAALDGVRLELRFVESQRFREVGLQLLGVPGFTDVPAYVAAVDCLYRCPRGPRKR